MRPRHDRRTFSRDHTRKYVARIIALEKFPIIDQFLVLFLVFILNSINYHVAAPNGEYSFIRKLDSSRSHLRNY